MEEAFSELQVNFNAFADVFREISMLKSTPTFDEPLYLNKANPALAQVQQQFQGRLSRFEKPYKPKRIEVCRFVVGRAVLPAAIEDADPLEDQDA